MKRQREVIPLHVDPCHKKQRSEGKSMEKKTTTKYNFLIDNVNSPESGKTSKEEYNDKGCENGRHPCMRIGGYIGMVGKIHEYYDSSGSSHLSRILYDQLVYFKEVTDFDNVQVLRAKKLTALPSHYYITFKAFSAGGIAETFQTNICYYFPKPCTKIEIISVRIGTSDFDDFVQDSQNDQPSNLDKIYRQRLKTQSHDSRFKLAVYLSQFSLVNYNIRELRVNAAMHHIQSLKIVKPMKLVRKGTTYLVTFEASLCADSNNVETFDTEICMRTLFPTTTIEFWNFRIKPN